MSDGPFLQVCAEAEGLINSGAVVFQKFTCLACSARQTISEPNVFYTKGQCQECGFVTDLQITGHGFMMIAASGDVEEFAKELQKEMKNARPINRN